MMKQFLSIVLFITSLAMYAQQTAQKKHDESQAKKPNILFIAVDDLRPELNFYGANHIKSPNLAQLSGESLVFNSA